LSDEYTNLKEEDRIGLLHEGSGPKVMSAFVEIIFDNSDGRLPIDKDEVAIKRAIGMKKDQYFLDKKVVVKSDILNFLETAGFSRNNPYYIVKQGKINEISIAKDSFRLKILKEVAGSNVYDEKKQESSVILKETEDKRQSIVDVLKAIEDRLTQLEVEKEELKEFQKWDKMKRSIEYTIHNKELEQTQNKLNEIQKMRSESSNQSSDLYEKLNSIGEQVKQVEKSMRDLKSREQLLKDELDQLNNERSQYLQRKARFEFDIKDAEDETKQANISVDLAQNELKRIENFIKSSEERLDQIRPEYDALRTREAELTQQRNLCDQKRNEIFAKQGRSTRFRNKEERDKWIKKELEIITKAINDKKHLADKLKQELDEETKKCDKFRHEIQAISQRRDEQQLSIEESEREHFELMRKKDELQTKRNELWRTETQLTQEASQLRDEQLKCEQNLRSITGRTLLQGIESIRSLLKQFEQENKNKDLIKGYHGLLIDNIECERGLFTAVETSVSSRLFYHIVDTDQTAMKFLKLMNQQKLQGEVNYLPLNVINNDTDSGRLKYPETTDAKPLIKQLKYDDAKVGKAIKHVFERILVCRNSEVATQLAKETKMDCVLLDGDFVSRKGALTGGYVDTRQSKLAYYRQKIELSDLIKKKEQEMIDLQSEIRQVDSQLNNVLNDLQKHETKGKRNKDTHEQMKSDLLSRKHEIERYERQKPQKERSVQSLLDDIEQFKSKEEMLNAELGTELLSQLSSEEQTHVDHLNEQIHKLNHDLKEVLTRRSQTESEKLQLDNQLQNNFQKRREDLLQQLSTNKIQQRSNKIDLYKNELKLLNEKIDHVEIKIRDISKDLDDLNRNELVKFNQQLDNLQDAERKLQDDLQESTVDLEKVSSKLSLLLKKKDECLKATRNLGVLPQDAYDKYQDMPMKELYFKLDHCNQELKKLSHVNKKAMDQFVQFSEHKEKLIQRRDEADRAYRSILDFINTLDQRKNENMQMTFKQVSKYFNEIFLKLVPQGTAHLVMRKYDNFEEEDRQKSTQDSEKSDVSSTPAVEEYTGVGIRVSFTGKSNEMKDIQQLSGGQKTLVALGLIFAIQRCDPAPFYLFDEIDQALDPQYRKAVADMIHELSEKAQFITTTFRPELLENSDKFYGVRFRNKISIIDSVTKEEAFDFVEDDQTHK
jgi:structural maintenance of chromosome 3 (chondroitin sulfate proteoglycan 6)